MTHAYSKNGQMGPSTTVARVTLRPIGSPLPLGAFSLVPAGLLVAWLQIGWFAPSEGKSVAYLLLAFVVPLEIMASIFAFLGRDALVGTSFGIFAGTWLAFAVSILTSAPGSTSPVLGVFFLSVGAIFVMLVGGGIFGGKVAAGAIILTGSARFILSGLYEATGASGLEHAAGIIGLVFAAVAGYVGLATLLEDSARRQVLPMGRRGAARASFNEGLGAQLDELEHEAGVREQL
jgi:hypothetical protein